jgi:ubiquinone/menaquinone biosynthesis C-methylase UbiE
LGKNSGTISAGLLLKKIKEKIIISIRRWFKTTYGLIPEGDQVFRWEIFKKYLNLSKDDVVLDIGGGTGVWTNRIAPHVALAINIDLEERSGGYGGSLETAKEKRLPNIELIKGDICHLPIKNGGISKAVSSQVLEHVTDLERALSEVERVLANQGVFVSSCPNSQFIENHRFKLTVAVRAVVKKTGSNLPNYVVGDFVSKGVEGYDKKAGHVRCGVSLQELYCLTRSTPLKYESHTYLHKILYPVTRELADVIPILYKSLRPLLVLAFFFESRLNYEGDDLIVRFKKNETR